MIEKDYTNSKMNKQRTYSFGKKFSDQTIEPDRINQFFMDGEIQ